MTQAASPASPSPVDEKTAHGTTRAAPRPLLRQGSRSSSMNGPLYMQAPGSNVILVRRVKRREEGLGKQLARWMVENQIGLSFNLIALLFLSHVFIPKARTHTHKFFHLAYYNPKSGKYGVGFDDVYPIIYCIVLFTGLRAWTMEYLLAPLAKLNGITKRKTLIRFSEQGWLIVYYTVFWTLGVYIYVTSPFFLSLKNLWIDWPDREIQGLVKGYLLAQWAFWLQQIIVINIEDRRKDHWQMFSHHIITSGLICACYFYHQTRVGTLFLVIMDVVDLFLSPAKCLKYCGYTTICDVAFGAFMVSWVVARHVLYMAVCWSIYAHIPTIIGSACFKGANGDLVGPLESPAGWSYLVEPFFNPSGMVCFDTTVRWAFLTSLLLLQGITIVWFAMIIRVAIKVIRGDGAEDSRSDDEDDESEEEEDEFVYEEARPLEEDVSAEALNLKNWERRAGHKRPAASSGVSLPGHSDRKEFLGRIGCEKQVD